ncbi:hypothetical protein SK571_28465 [Lentzea sp. BCCO 10_0798]|uniref:Uncharacterized protein n=1 Tax=Lentzea kristufekii TaxID=3095430 RepID=A0ABU4TZX2_9PSEU|nr:hypothetical protein [Lentzea sp. BCCO 10_0798]MDX8053326.1 hypothetical protein [Lentzea sp. BCCO 10_0798]
MAGVTVLSTTPAVAQQPPVLSANPSVGAPGTAFKVAWTGIYFDPDCTNFAMRVLWDGKTVVGSGTGGGRGTGSGSATVPANATAGGHRVTVQATSCQAGAATTTFTVRVPPTTTTTQPPVTTRPPVTNPPVTNPPVTTRPPVITTTTTPPVTTTTTTTTTTDSSTPSSSSTTDALTNPGDGVLVLDKDNIQPGDDLTATGTGCPKGASVTLKSLGQDVGRTTADENGEFRSPVRFANIEPGRHKVRAECGIVLVGNVDVTLSSSSQGTTSTLVVLLFFLLVGAAMLRRQFSGLRR